MRATPLTRVQELALVFLTRLILSLSGKYLGIGQGICLFVVGIAFTISLSNYQYHLLHNLSFGNMKSPPNIYNLVGVKLRLWRVARRFEVHILIILVVRIGTSLVFSDSMITINGQYICP